MAVSEWKDGANEINEDWKVEWRLNNMPSGTQVDFSFYCRSKWSKFLLWDNFHD